MGPVVVGDIGMPAGASALAAETRLTMVREREAELRNVRRADQQQQRAKFGHVLVAAWELRGRAERAFDGERSAAMRAGAGTGDGGGAGRASLQTVALIAPELMCAVPGGGSVMVRAVAVANAAGWARVGTSC